MLGEYRKSFMNNIRLYSKNAYDIQFIVGFFVALERDESRAPIS